MQQQERNKDRWQHLEEYFSKQATRASQLNCVDVFFRATGKIYDTECIIFKID